MPQRPSGTVTFLFSDIEGSTRLLRDLGSEGYGAALDDHRRLVREAVATAGGTEIDTQGDAFFVAFPRAEDAARAAVEIQRRMVAHRWPWGGQLRVRIGIHSTGAVVGEEGYVGIGVHRAARICAAAHGGQVVVSNASAELLRDAEGRFTLADLGLHWLKDLSEPEHLFQLATDGPPDRFPPLRSLDNRPTNLPSQPTPLIGRERELAVIAAMLRGDVRMATLTGAGGSGKTRLALEVARELLDDYSDGVFHVPLATVGDPSLVLPTIAKALGINEGAGQSLAAYLTPRHLLLVIDNVEQVASAAPDLAALLASAPEVRMLVTSREPMHVSAEQVLSVGPMAGDDAVSLFAARAAAARSDFALTDDNRPVVAEICARLDRLPLAIELAAARISVLTPEAMITRLIDRLKLLTGGPRDQPARHRTLRDTIAWSHDLLTGAERDLFACLSVFAGQFSLNAAESVCDADLDVLGSLVDRSLVRRDGDRFGMLSTIRDYAAERLAERGESAAVRERHAACFEALADHAYAERHRQSATMAYELALDHDDLRDALDWLSQTDPRRFSRLAGALGWFWHAHSHFVEGRARVEAALAIIPANAGEDRARLLSAATELAAWQGDSVAAERFGMQAAEAWRALDRNVEVGLVLYDLGWGHFFAGEDDAARQRLEASLEIHESHGDSLLTNRAQLGLLQVLVAVGDVATVKRIGLEALAMSQALGDRWSEHFAHHFLGDCAVIEGDVPEAERRYRLSLVAAWETGDQVETCYELQGMAMAAAGAGNATRALRLASAAEAKIGKLGVEGIPPFWVALVDRHVATARAQLGDEQADEAWAAGSELSLREAVDEALGAGLSC
ncbi:MAG: adenylate/guanylate cyclase domain-containing protein [Candidatus Limnocylindria bacterium]